MKHKHGNSNLSVSSSEEGGQASHHQVIQLAKNIIYTGQAIPQR